MKKWQIVAYPECDEGNLSRKEAIIYAETDKKAVTKGFKMFPEYHEIGVFEIEEDNK